LTYRPAPVPPGAVPAPAIEARLEPDAIGMAQDTVIGMASSAPAGTMAATLAAASAYGSGPVLILTALPMLIIANSYRRLNMWSANCGASFEWASRAINPYLGFITGWLMIAGYVTGTVAGVVVLGPSVLAVFGSSSAYAWASIGIDTALCLIMLAIAVAGIRITARAQLGMVTVEYLILIVFSAAGLLAVFGHRAGTFPVTRGWFNLSGIGGHGSLAAGLLIAVYTFSLRDGTVYVNEEVKHRRENPGKAAIYAVALLTVLYTLAQAGPQGLVSPARLPAKASTAMVYLATALGGTGWARLMALAIALRDSSDRHRHRAHRPDRLRHGQLPDAAAAARPGILPGSRPRPPQAWRSARSSSPRRGPISWRRPRRPSSARW
jgi:amino acid transporter